MSNPRMLNWSALLLLYASFAPASLISLLIFKELFNFLTIFNFFPYRIRRRTAHLYIKKKKNGLIQIPLPHSEPSCEGLGLHKI
jgi:hypothetical protein